MSNTASILNFAVDVEGNEVPIRYKAEHLVNVLAPEGYVWQKRTVFDDMKDEFFAKYDVRLAERQKWFDDYTATLAARLAAESPSQRAIRQGQERAYPKEPRTRPVYQLDEDWADFEWNHKTGPYEPYYVAKKI